MKLKSLSKVWKIKITHWQRIYNVVRYKLKKKKRFLMKREYFLKNKN